MARNQLNDAAIDIGGTVLPAIAGAAERVGALSEAFTGLPDPVKDSVVQLGGAVTALSTIGGLALMAIPKLEQMNATLRNTGAAGASMAKGFSAVGAGLAGPWGIALAAATIGLGLWAESQYQAQQRAEELAATLDEQTGAITENSRAWAVSTLLDSGALEDAKALGVSLDLVTDAALGSKDAAAQLDTEFEALLTRQRDLVNTGGATVTSYDEVMGRVTHLRQIMGGSNTDLENARTQWELTNEAMNASGEAASGAVQPNEQLNNAIVADRGGSAAGEG